MGSFGFVGFLVAGAILLAIGLALPKKEKPPKAKEPKPKSKLRKRATHFESDTWARYELPPNPDLRPPKWVAIPGAGEFNVAGTSHHRENCTSFFTKLDPDTAFATVAWETDRDPPGLMVIVHPKKGAPGLFVGYAPAEISGMIRKTYERDMPIAARLKTVGQHVEEDATFFTIALVGPAKKERERFEVLSEQ